MGVENQNTSEDLLHRAFFSMHVKILVVIRFGVFHSVRRELSESIDVMLPLLCESQTTPQPSSSRDLVRHVASENKMSDAISR